MAQLFVRHTDHGFELSESARDTWRDDWVRLAVPPDATLGQLAAAWEEAYALKIERALLWAAGPEGAILFEPVWRSLRKKIKRAL